MTAGIQKYLQYVDAYTEQAEAFTRELCGNAPLEMGRAKDQYHDYWEWRVQEFEKKQAAIYEEAQSRMRLAYLCTGMNHKLATPIENIILDLAITKVPREGVYSG